MSTPQYSPEPSIQVPAQPGPDYFSAPGTPPQHVGEALPDDEEFFFDSFSPETRFRFYLPDKKQYIEFKAMNEGDKLQYERRTNRDLKVDRKTDLAHIRVDQGSDRHALIEICVTDWYIKIRKTRGDGFENYAFTKPNLNTWLQLANPKIVADLQSDIIKKNPGILGVELTVEDIDNEIKDLEERRADLLKEQAGNG